MHTNIKKETFSILVMLTILAIFFQAVIAWASPSVKTEKDTYVFGEMIKVIFSGSPGNEEDWICIVPVGSPDTEAGDYKYMPKGLSNGFLSFDPPSPGKYEVRAYYDYRSKGYVVSARYAFAVASSPEYEKSEMLRMESMERKVDPNNPIEANLTSEKGGVYIFREPWAMSDIADIQIKANGTPIIVMPKSTYYLYPTPAGEVSFSTGVLTERNIQSGDREEVWAVRSGEATIKVKPGYVYYIKLKVIPMGGWGSYLDNVPHQEGANFISNNKLTQIEK